MGRRALQRMAKRMVRRAGISGEEGVAVSFGFSSLWAAVVIALLEELPYIGLLSTLLTFPLHRFVLVTDRNTYIFRGRPFHWPGERLGTYPNGPGIVSRVRGKLTFSDGQVVWHSPLFSWRVAAVTEAATAGSAATQAPPPQFAASQPPPPPPPQQPPPPAAETRTG